MYSIKKLTRSLGEDFDNLLVILKMLNIKYSLNETEKFDGTEISLIIYSKNTVTYEIIELWFFEGLEKFEISGRLYSIGAIKMNFDTMKESIDAIIKLVSENFNN